MVLSTMHRRTFRLDDAKRDILDTVSFFGGHDRHEWNIDGFWLLLDKTESPLDVLTCVVRSMLDPRNATVTLDLCRVLSGETHIPICFNDVASATAIVSSVCTLVQPLVDSTLCVDYVIEGLAPSELLTQFVQEYDLSGAEWAVSRPLQHDDDRNDLFDILTHLSGQRRRLRLWKRRYVSRRCLQRLASVDYFPIPLSALLRQVASSFVSRLVPLAVLESIARQLRAVHTDAAVCRALAADTESDDAMRLLLKFRDDQTVERMDARLVAVCLDLAKTCVFSGHFDVSEVAAMCQEHARGVNLYSTALMVHAVYTSYRELCQLVLQPFVSIDLRQLYSTFPYEMMHINVMEWNRPVRLQSLSKLRRMVAELENVVGRLSVEWKNRVIEAALGHVSVKFLLDVFVHEMHF